MSKTRPPLPRSNMALNKMGLPTHIQKLAPNIYKGGIRDWQIFDTRNGKKLSFNIFFTVYGTEKICLPKMFDFQNCIIVGTPLFSFLDELGIIEEHGKISWDDLIDMPVKVEIKVSKKGTPYINSVTTLKEEQYDEEYDDEYDDEEYDEEEYEEEEYAEE